MDTGEGRFEPIDVFDYKPLQNQVNELRQKYPKSKGIFSVGETLEVKRLKFKVKKITAFAISLRYLSEDETNNMRFGSAILPFDIGENLEIKTSSFEVIDIFPKGIKLKLLVKDS